VARVTAPAPRPVPYRPVQEPGRLPFAVCNECGGGLINAIAAQGGQVPAWWDRGVCHGPGRHARPAAPLATNVSIAAQQWRAQPPAITRDTVAVFEGMTEQGQKMYVRLVAQAAQIRLQSGGQVQPGGADFRQPSPVDHGPLYGGTVYDRSPGRRDAVSRLDAPVPAPAPRDPGQAPRAITGTPARPSKWQQALRGWQERLALETGR
jgi:hypothetical protein